MIGAGSARVESDSGDGMRMVAMSHAPASVDASQGGVSRQTYLVGLALANPVLRLGVRPLPPLKPHGRRVQMPPGKRAPLLAATSRCQNWTGSLLGR